MKTSTKKTARTGHRNLSDFFARYGAILETVARRVHAQVARGVKYTSTEDVATWIARDLPTLYKSAFPARSVPLPLKVWRLKTMLSNASYLGAYDDLDIKALRGKGITSVVAPRGRGQLTVIRGGKR